MSCLRLRLPSCRPHLLHPLADGFLHRLGHLATTTAADSALDGLDGRRQETTRVPPKMWEIPIGLAAGLG
jgi:hypothetical protein